MGDVTKTNSPERRVVETVQNFGLQQLSTSTALARSTEAKKKPYRKPVIVHSQAPFSSKTTRSVLMVSISILLSCTQLLLFCLTSFTKQFSKILSFSFYSIFRPGQCPSNLLWPYALQPASCLIQPIWLTHQDTLQILLRTRPTVMFLPAHLRTNSWRAV